MIRRSASQLLSDMLGRAERLRDIHASKAASRDLDDAPEILDAVLLNFIVLGEIANRLGEPFHQQHPEIPWVAIIGQRNVIAHGYDILDLRSLRESVEEDIPLLIHALQQVLKQYPPPPSEPHP